MTKFIKVDVKDIKSEQLRSNLSEENIEKLADLILESGGLFQALILKQIGVENYLVLDGHLEYFAAVRAREKDPRKGEIVNAFVITAKDEETVKEQIQLLRGGKLPPNVTSSTGGNSPTIDSNWISSFETRLSQIREELSQKNLNLESRLSQLEKEIIKSPKKELLDFLNTSEKQELIDELSRHGIKAKIIEAIYIARNQQESKKFASYKDVIASKTGLAEKGLLGLIDSWARIYKK